ncbi:YdaS family helix-turn-helix protein [Roseateles sp. SL47]|uniref:YdaS family helix-turn-helix protein n=1 Tax=Roseateles sp. SL47 TaxID=2995138 RepID=UPI00226D46E1|nr:YdaS family helix-turn-helix protein [Roseateles sp. SL47]WAC75331.1 YdaS family helix-turn-helix protein [Roseateles sp. SL47]
MQLIELKRTMDKDGWRSLAGQSQTSVGHLNNVAYGHATANAALARRIEELSNQQVRRWTLRPDDWHVIWPELVGTDGAPSVPAEQGA